jgi:hypothetical protein
MNRPSFSQSLNSWLKDSRSKTFGDLEKFFQEKSFAVVFLILMAPAALPLPTGGVTHVFEIITMLLAAELVIGRKSIWVPQSWRQRNLGETMQKKALPKLVSFIQWFEKRSEKRLLGLVKHRFFGRFVGVLIFLLALGSFLAVPFSGLDTLPALGVVVISLSLILEDALVFLVGLSIGIVGVLVEIFLGSAVLHFLHL